MEIGIRIQNFIEDLGHDPLLLEYSVRFADRRVFQYSRDGALRVCKIRPESDRAHIEIENAEKWFSYNGIANIFHESSRGLLALDMPWLGETLGNLENIMLGYDPEYSGHPFNGFDVDTTEALISDTMNRMYGFAQCYGLVHNDLFVLVPNNILHIPGTNHLSIIDPEAFTECHNDSWSTFINQIGNVRKYMLDFLNS